MIRETASFERATVRAEVLAGMPAPEARCACGNRAEHFHLVSTGARAGRALHRALCADCHTQARALRALRPEGRN